jgi:hypothetical protein
MVERPGVTIRPPVRTEQPRLGSVPNTVGESFEPGVGEAASPRRSRAACHVKEGGAAFKSRLREMQHSMYRLGGGAAFRYSSGCRHSGAESKPGQINRRIRQA